MSELDQDYDDNDVNLIDTPDDEPAAEPDNDQDDDDEAAATAISVLDLLVCSLVDDPDAFPEFLGVPEAHGTAVVVLDDKTVLMSASAPQTARLLAERGLEVVIVPITEFEKLEGCVTCLSVRLRD